jgi:predicted nucleotidyltransferase
VILHRPFEVVTPTVDGDVLTVLARADAAFTPPQVQELAGRHSVAGVRNALNRLTDQGLVQSEQVGRAFIYRLNRDHVAAPHVVALAEAGQTVVQRMRELLGSWVTPPDYAALFGSAATGKMTTSSDLDVLIVRPTTVDAEGEPAWHDQLDDFTRSCTRWTGNDTRVLDLSSAEIRSGATTDRVLRAIARDGILLAGPTEYLSRYLRATRKAKGTAG